MSCAQFFTFVDEQFAFLFREHGFSYVYRDESDWE